MSMSINSVSSRSTGKFVLNHQIIAAVTALQADAFADQESFLEEGLLKVSYFFDESIEQRDAVRASKALWAPTHPLKPHFAKCGNGTYRMWFTRRRK